MSSRYSPPTKRQVPHHPIGTPIAACGSRSRARQAGWEHRSGRSNTSRTRARSSRPPGLPHGRAWGGPRGPGCEMRTGSGTTTDAAMRAKAWAHRSRLPDGSPVRHRDALHPHTRQVHCIIITFCASSQHHADPPRTCLKFLKGTCHKSAKVPSLDHQCGDASPHHAAGMHHGARYWAHLQAQAPRASQVRGALLPRAVVL